MTDRPDLDGIEHEIAFGPAGDYPVVWKLLTQARRLEQRVKELEGKQEGKPTVRELEQILQEPASEIVTNRDGSVRAKP